MGRVGQFHDRRPTGSWATVETQAADVSDLAIAGAKSPFAQSNNKSPRRDRHGRSRVARQRSVCDSWRRGTASSRRESHKFESFVAGSRARTCRRGRGARAQRRVRSPRSARPRGAVVDLGPDHDARLAAGLRLLQVLAAGGRCEGSGAEEAARPGRCSDALRRGCFSASARRRRPRRGRRARSRKSSQTPRGDSSRSSLGARGRACGYLSTAHNGDSSGSSPGADCRYAGLCSRSTITWKSFDFTAFLCGACVM
jgi:hypothetical protein